MTERKEAVDHLSHYGGADDPYEVIKVIEAWGLNQDFYLGNAIKYIARAGKKDGSSVLEDLKKARWYLERKITRLTVSTSERMRRQLPAVGTLVELNVHNGWIPARVVACTPGVVACTPDGYDSWLEICSEAAEGPITRWVLKPESDLWRWPVKKSDP